jgi:Fe-S cluster assembly scaffold protein SufB
MQSQSHSSGIFHGSPSAHAAGEQLGSQLPVAEGCAADLVVFSSSGELSLSVSKPRTHTLVVVEAGVHAVLTEILNIDDDCSRGIEVIVEDGGSLEYMHLQTSSAARVRVSQRSSLGARARVHWCNATLGGNEVHHDLVSTIQGPQARSSVDWMFFAKNEEHYQLSARNIFDAADGGGEMTLKGVAQDHAQVECNGLIEIGLRGGGTDTYLFEDVLMLDSTAKVDAIPGLEIKTNDVKASHSATVSKISDADLFYFQSRAIGKQKARRMCTEGFLKSVLAQWTDPVLRETAEQCVARQFSSLSEEI